MEDIKLTRADLKTRGWTKFIFNEFKPLPDDSFKHPKSGVMTRLWNLKKIQQIENSNEFLLFKQNRCPNIDWKVGFTFNNVKIISISRKILESGKTRAYFIILCHCGKEFSARSDYVNKVTSCGCLTSDILSEKGRKINGLILVLLRSYVTNAKKRNIPFEISFEEFENLIFKNCIYCGSAPSESKYWKTQKNGRRTRSLFCNGIDRYDNNIGYKLSNCVPCCANCNRAKNTSSAEDFEKWITNLVEFRNNKKNEL